MADAPNVVTLAGSSAINMAIINKTKANLIADMDACKIGLETDTLKLAYVDHALGYHTIVCENTLVGTTVHIRTPFNSTNSILTLENYNDGVNPGNSLVLRNTILAHGVTSVLPTTDFGSIGSNDVNASNSSDMYGGLKIVGISSDSNYDGIRLYSIGSSGGLVINSAKPNGTGVAGFTLGEAIFSVLNNGLDKFKVYDYGMIQARGGLKLMSPSNDTNYWNIGTTIGTGYSRLAIEFQTAAILALSYGAEGSGSAEVVTSFDTGARTASFNQSVRLGIGGSVQVKFTADGNITTGYLVSCQGTSANGRAIVNPTLGDMPVGIAMNDATAGVDVWVCVAGRCQVYVTADTVRGDVLYSSVTVGQADAASSAPAAATHFKECGHATAARTGAGLVDAIIHFN